MLYFCLTDPFAEADEDTGETKQSQNYIHIRIQRMSHNLAPRSLIVTVGASAPRQAALRVPEPRADFTS
jgi:hypothetical protein